MEGEKARQSILMVSLLRRKTELYRNKKRICDIITLWLMNYIRFMTLSNIDRPSREDSELHNSN